MSDWNDLSRRTKPASKLSVERHEGRIKRSDGVSVITGGHPQYVRDIRARVRAGNDKQEKSVETMDKMSVLRCSTSSRTSSMGRSR
ncbi:hypothetical protein NPIL_532251 [Nephila pilipes]|uniref:Uncharacterized protein n=1 Tax=Nephila pilipes TaxID=299642 RepID=A0A8X6QCJ3_NEPPI|nr:hypothetical protein NPIL_532251 [Nephila pilipes]